MKTFINQLPTRYSARGIPTFEIEIEHKGLHKHKVIREKDPGIAKKKALAEAEAWDEIWEKRSNQSTASNTALEKTTNSQDAINELDRILFRALEIDDALDWELLKNVEPFPIPYPIIQSVSKPVLATNPPRPDRDAPTYQPKFSFYDRISAIFGRVAVRKIEAAEIKFENDFTSWKEAVANIEQRNAKRERAFHDASSVALKAFENGVQAWQSQKETYLKRQIEHNDSVDLEKRSYAEKSSKAVQKYCELVLDNSSYPSYFPKKFALQFEKNTGMILLDYLLPSIDDIPTLTEVKYIASRNEFSEKHLSDIQKGKLYDNVIYQIALRTIHELFEADTVDAVSAVVFNGWVSALNRATGHTETNCILSLQAGKEEFTHINLIAVEPRVCFKQLKGVAAAKLSTMTAVPPLVRLNKSDRRFVSSYEVVDSLDSGVNLASMDWQDFEHLIRGLFEKEFSVNGGEVKVTQASRDGGVDAIAFDPDPIRGGKIVIQAKRYTNTVSVSAVRDLYGTVMNEGATKGILVTTSDYGPDAYEFAHNKPLSLLNGGNLLFLLQKHGQQAKIDIKEAKKYFDDQK